MIDARFVPLPSWPYPPTRDRGASRFRSGYTSTLDLLGRELDQLGAQEIEIRAGFERGQLRNDGFPYSGASPSHPGIIIAYRSRRTRYAMPCDRYQTWRENLHAIALSLEALRAVDRYGVTRQGEQYSGFAALPSQSSSACAPAAQAGAQASAAAQLLATWAGVDAAHLLASRDAFTAAWRAAVKEHHPDAGGEAARFHELQAAAAVLNRHHGEKG